MQVCLQTRRCGRKHVNSWRRGALPCLPAAGWHIPWERQALGGSSSPQAGCIAGNRLLSCTPCLMHTKLNCMLRAYTFPRLRCFCPIASTDGVLLSAIPQCMLWLSRIHTRGMTDELATRAHMLEWATGCADFPFHPLPPPCRTSQHLALATMPSPPPNLPCASAQQAEYYRQQQPEAFEPHERQAAEENGTVLRVAFMPRAGGLRAIRNLEEVAQVR